jgi:hypothetical protein
MMTGKQQPRGTIAGARRRLEAAIHRLSQGWEVLADVSVRTPLETMAVDYLLMDPNRGVVLLDYGEPRALQSELPQQFRRFLETRGFDAFFPGFLPLVHLTLGDDGDQVLADRIASAFAEVPPTTVRDRSWAGAIATVLLSDAPDDPIAYPEKPAPAEKHSLRPTVEPRPTRPAPSPVNWADASMRPSKPPSGQPESRVETQERAPRPAPEPRPTKPAPSPVSRGDAAPRSPRTAQIRRDISQVWRKLLSARPRLSVSEAESARAKGEGHEAPRISATGPVSFRIPPLRIPSLWIPPLRIPPLRIPPFHLSSKAPRAPQTPPPTVPVRQPSRGQRSPLLVADPSRRTLATEVPRNRHRPLAAAVVSLCLLLAIALIPSRVVTDLGWLPEAPAVSGNVAPSPPPPAVTSPQTAGPTTTASTPASSGRSAAQAGSTAPPVGSRRLEAALEPPASPSGAGPENVPPRAGVSPPNSLPSEGPPAPPPQASDRPAEVPSVSQPAPPKAPAKSTRTVALRPAAPRPPRETRVPSITEVEQTPPLPGTWNQGPPIDAADLPPLDPRRTIVPPR